MSAEYTPDEWTRDAISTPSEICDMDAGGMGHSLDFVMEGVAVVRNLQTRAQRLAALVREALEVAKNAYEEGQGSASFPWSMANAELAASNIEKSLEALEKEP